MKKFISGLVIGIITTISVSAFGANSIKLIINGVDITATMDVAPQIIDGRAMVPARYVAESLGATVDWDDKNNIITINSKTDDNNETITNSGQDDTVHSFSEWSGTWNAITSFLDDEGLDNAYETLAQRNGTTAEEEKAILKQKYKTDLTSFKIEENNLIVYSEIQNTQSSISGEVLSTSEYKFVGTMPTDAGYTWYKFEAVGEAANKYLLLLPVGEDTPGVTMKHLHYRYGNTSFEELFNISGWFPTMTTVGTAIELIANDFTL